MKNFKTQHTHNQWIIYKPCCVNMQRIISYIQAWEKELDYTSTQNQIDCILLLAHKTLISNIIQETCYKLLTCYKTLDMLQKMHPQSSLVSWSCKSTGVPCYTFSENTLFTLRFDCSPGTGYKLTEVPISNAHMDFLFYINHFPVKR